MVVRACYHREEHLFVYSNQRMRFQQEVRASRVICSECRSGIKQLVQAYAAGSCANAAMWKGRLPELVGKPGQIRWAASIRAQAAAHYFPILDEVVAAADMPLAGVRSSLRLLFSISSCSFWIDARDKLLDQAWLTNEVEILTRMSDSMAEPVPQESACGYWKKVKPDLVDTARKATIAKEIRAAA